MSYYFVGQQGLNSSTTGTSAVYTGNVTAQSFTFSALNKALAWTSGGSFTQATDGVYTLTDAAADNNVSLQIGTGTANMGTGNLGITFGTRGSANAVNISKNAAGAQFAIQTGAGAWTAAVASSWGLNGSAGSVLGMSFTGTTCQLNGATGVQRNKVVAVSKAASYPVVAGDADTVFDNTGAGGTVVTFTLPAAAVGLTYTFCNVLTTALSQVVIAPNSGSDLIAFGTKVAGNSVSSPVATRSSIKVTCTAANVWAVESTLGTWT